MVRRPLIATVVTTAVGALLGAILGALVGRVIALFGDETVQTSVPMAFCGTLGFFVGGASAAKGSLDRFGAKRAGLGAFVALVVLVVLVGGTSVSHQAGLVIVVVGVVAAGLAGAAATFVSAPQDAPVVRGGIPKPVSPPKAADAPSQAQFETKSVAVAPRPAIRKVAVAEPEPEPEPEPAADEQVNWTLPDEREPARPRRDRPLRRDDVAAEPEAPAITPPPAPRQRRERPLRKGDA